MATAIVFDGNKEQATMVYSMGVLQRYRISCIQWRVEFSSVWMCGCVWPHTLF